MNQVEHSEPKKSRKESNHKYYTNQKLRLCLEAQHKYHTMEEEKKQNRKAQMRAAYHRRKEQQNAGINIDTILTDIGRTNDNPFSQ